MRIFVVIPAYNEEKYLSRVLKKVCKVTKHVVLVNDGSRDNTSKIAQRYLNHVISHVTNVGKGAALKTGCDFAFKKLKADAVIFMDSDDQHDVHELSKFVKELKKGAYIVFGVRRFSSTVPLMRLLGNRFASILLNFLFHHYIPDIPSGYKAISAKAYKKIRWESSGYEVETEIAVKVAQQHIPYTIVEINGIYHDMEKGMTAIDAAKIAKCLVQWKLGI